MGLILVALCLVAVIWLYFTHNPLHHSKAFMMRRFINWFPLGMSYAFLYMARYNLNVSKNALGAAMSKESFGLIFGIGTTVYGLSFLINGPLIDKIGGKKGIVMATLGSSIANIAMGIVTFLFLKKRLNTNLTVVFLFLYCYNIRWNIWNAYFLRGLFRF
jgi:OPA family glycerol-3-phosphate transporter-like MFS transporter